MDNDPIAAHPTPAPALVEGDRTITYGELRHSVASTAGWLLSLGVGRGDRLALLGDNDAAFVTGLLAAHAAGAAVCPLSAQDPDRLLAERVAHLDPAAMLASPAAAELAVQVAGGAGLDQSRLGSVAGSPSALAPPPTIGPAAPADVSRSDLAAVLHTSGIVGAPRAVMLTHGNLRSAQERVLASGPSLRSTDVVFAALPFTHVLGLNIVLLPYLRTGATVVLQPRWDPVEALDLIERHRVTHIVGVPPMWAAWAELADRGSNPMRSVTFARAGASSLHASVAGAVHEAFGLELVQGYGLTETAGTVTLEPAARLRPGSVGRPLPGVELQLVENGEPVEPGDRGEVWIRAPSVFAGYLDDPAATAEVLVTGGWCRSGDIGIQDDDGSLYLVGRSKDLINVSGFNVYPAEVEAVLEQHAGIRAAVVVGEPHALTGECVVAYVIAPGGLDPDDVTAHCQQRLSRYKVPVSMHLVDRLPLTNIGKRVRSRLR